MTVWQSGRPWPAVERERPRGGGEGQSALGKRDSAYTPGHGWLRSGSDVSPVLISAPCHETRFMKVVKDMGVTGVELLSALPALLGRGRCRVRREGIVYQHDDKRVTFFVGPERQRAIGSLLLPTTRVVIVMDGFSDEEASAFIEWFDLRFRRGGG